LGGTPKKKIGGGSQGFFLSCFPCIVPGGGDLQKIPRNSGGAGGGGKGGGGGRQGKKHGPKKPTRGGSSGGGGPGLSEYKRMLGRSLVRSRSGREGGLARQFVLVKWGIEFPRGGGECYVGGGGLGEMWGVVLGRGGVGGYERGGTAWVQISRVGSPRETKRGREESKGGPPKRGWGGAPFHFFYSLTLNSFFGGDSREKGGGGGVENRGSEGGKSKFFLGGETFVEEICVSEEKANLVWK